MDISVIIFAALFCCFALWLLYSANVARSPLSMGICALLLIAFMGLRLAVLDYETLDYQNFLSRWVEFYRQNGGFAALDTPVGNYNIPYLYFLALFSYFDVSDLHLIKLLSVFFDIILAWSCMLLVGRFTESPVRKGAVFFTAFMWPTVFLNGALWAQCDSSYVAFALLGIWFALEDRPWHAMVCAAVSFVACTSSSSARRRASCAILRCRIMTVFRASWKACLMRVSFRGDISLLTKDRTSVRKQLRKPES